MWIFVLFLVFFILLILSLDFLPLEELTPQEAEDARMDAFIAKYTQIGARDLKIGANVVIPTHVYQVYDDTAKYKGVNIYQLIVDQAHDALSEKDNIDNK